MAGLSHVVYLTILSGRLERLNLSKITTVGSIGGGPTSNAGNHCIRCLFHTNFMLTLFLSEQVNIPERTSSTGYLIGVRGILVM